MSFSMIDGITGSIRLLETGAKGRAKLAMESMAVDIQLHAQYTAPWSDRTGEAREGLSVEVYEEGDELVLDLYHTVAYGEWLEVIQSGKFATIMPTLEIFAPRLFERAGAHLMGKDGAS